MIIIRITSGLGNQLFQYAFARINSLKRKEKLWLDTSNFSSSDNRHFQLNNFNIIYDGKINFCLNRILFRLISRINIFLPKLISFFKIYIEQKPMVYNPMFSVTKFIYYSGYFQSEKYFSKYRKLLLRELTPKTNIKSKYDYLFNNKNNLIAIHVRRGDYLTEVNKKVFVTYDVNYFYKSIKFISNKIKNPHFLIFSDDISWCRKNLKIDYPNTYVNASDAVTDLFLMSKCDHQIISNSSFSWWAAWLNINKNKIVIAPKKWINSDYNDYKDIYPSNWIKL